MNIEQAKAISMSEILAILGYSPIKQRGADIWYNAPFRQDKTASFHIHATHNIWYDFGIAKGGNVIDFICYYLEQHGEDHTTADALRWLGNMYLLPQVKIDFKDPKEDRPALTLKRVSPVQHPSLVAYLQSRGINLSLAKKYIKEAYLHNANSGKNFYSLAMKNEGDGYELRNNFFKGCIAPKSISFIRGSKPVPQDIHVFEGFLDFLSAMTQQNIEQFEGDVIVLNSVNCLPQAFAYIGNYSYRNILSWLDNDKAGNKAVELLKAFADKHGNLDIKSMNNLYADHKDVNAWHMHKQGLRLI